MSVVTMATAARMSASLQRGTQHLAMRANLGRPGVLQMAAVTLVHRRSSSSNSRGNSSGSSGGWDSILIAPGACVLLALALCSTSEQAPAETGWWPFSRQPSSPFSNTVPRKAKKQRAKAETQMRKYLSEMRVPVQELMAGLRKGEVSREDFDKRMAAYNNEVELATHRIIFGVIDPPDARRRYEAKHGNCRHTPEAIQVVSALSPLVEINAGRGHWQRALTEAGATVVSFDRWATAPVGAKKGGMTAGMPQVGKVLPGDEHALRLHRDKTLLLVYPAPGDTALRCMREYRGDALVYVGEGRGGANASDEFFDYLDAEWDVTNIVDLDPFPQCFERLYVLRRRKQEGVASSPQEAAVTGSAGNVPVAPSR